MARADEPDREPTVVVGIVADEGFPTRVVGRLEHVLEPLLAERIDSTIRWDVRISSHTMPLTEENVVSLSQDVAAVKSEEEWDIAVHVTDLPRFHQNRVVVADLKVDDGLAIISLPALGVGMSRRLATVTLHVVGKLHAADASATAGRDRELKGTAGPVALAVQPHSEIDTYTASREIRGWLRLAVGMVLSNRPWRLVWDLKSAMAAAVAAGAFGIFYSSFTELADQMSHARLAMVTVVVLIITTLWMTIYNRLWETPARPRPRRRLALYNTSSLATVTISIVCMYAALLLSLFLGSAIVIPPAYLSAQLGHDIGVVTYLDVAWLSASMGMLAGALGASFDSRGAVRTALYSEREVARRRRAGDAQ